MDQHKKPAIVVTNVTKSFRIPLDKSSNLKQKILSKFRGGGYRDFTPLKNISFTIEEGDFFGIVGRNGSGKSTLLRTIAGIYSPNKGHVKLNGLLVPFIELGVGFNPELTGRENVYLNGALLGFSRSEIEDMYDDIVDFAELHDFMEEHLRNYSSGMQVRLAFSIAIRAKGDILLLDEVLAVGDSAFQQKCFDYFLQLKKEKKTVVLVSHSMASVQRFCNKALLLENGNIDFIGSSEEVAIRYEEMFLNKGTSEVAKYGDGDVRAAVTLSNNDGDQMLVVDAKKVEELTINVNLKSSIDIGKVRLGVVISNEGKTPIFATNSQVTQQPIDLAANDEKIVALKVDNVFSDGKYTIALSIRSYEDGRKTYFTEEEALQFVVKGREHHHALVSPSYKIELSE